MQQSAALLLVLLSFAGICYSKNATLVLVKNAVNQVSSYAMLLSGLLSFEGKVQFACRVQCVLTALLQATTYVRESVQAKASGFCILKAEDGAETRETASIAARPL